MTTEPSRILGNPRHRFLASLAAGLILGGGLASGGAYAQTDPGARSGSPAAGGPLLGLSPDLAAYFASAQPFFTQRVSVSGAIAGAPGAGLGPRFNLDSCGGCHAFPAIGGSSPPTNPEIRAATANGAANTIPPFITATGPVRVARFMLAPNGTPDGGVYNLFTIAGRSDAPGCTLPQQNFAQAIATRNIVFRIPTPIFGAGLIEAVPDANLIAAKAAGAAGQTSFGVGGRFNHDAADGTITRFGWKAQQKSLLAFAAEASLVEEGVTSDYRPNERDGAPNCQFNAAPEDRQPTALRNGAVSNASAFSSAVVNQAAFMRLTAPPARGPVSAAVGTGQTLFAAIGCTACHIPTQTTAPSALTGNQAVTFAPYSDFALHNMGAGLDDGVNQGEARSRDWRTAPLWGLGQRLFFIHDGRAADLPTAIQAHASPGSEGNQSVAAYNSLSASQKQSLILFLRSL